MPSGKRSPTGRGAGAPAPASPKLPAYIQTALGKNARAMRHFQALPPSNRREYLEWIESAKREETKARRLQEAVRLLTAGKPLGLK